MSDVLQLATRYRNRLKAELGKVEEFMRMAEDLAKSGELEGPLAFSKSNGEARPAETRPTEVKSGEAKSGEAKPGEAKSGEAQPAEAKAKPAEEPKTPFDRFRAAGG